MRYPYSSLEHEKVVLGSRFILSLYPLESKEEIKGLLEEVRAKYPKATHYPYAYRLLPLEGMSDDGEPKGSTGLPLLEALRQTETDRVLIVLTRYFGGTKLGLSRLTRTYRETLLEGLEKITLGEYALMDTVSLEMDYPLFEKVKRESEKLGLSIEETKFGLNVELKLSGDAKIVESLLERYKEGLKVLAKEQGRKRRIIHESQ